jgi:adenylate kinase
MNIVIMGPPGSGKTTQGELLAQKLNLPHIETGKIYRLLSEQNSDLGKKVKQILEVGGLIDDQTTFEVVDQHISEMKDGFVLEGFPRTLAQAQRELFLISKVINIALPEQEAIKRLMNRHRKDDVPEVIANRLKLYHERTEPILQYYRASGKLVEIDGLAPVNEVNNAIMALCHFRND